MDHDPVATAVRGSRYTQTELARRLGLSCPAFSDRMRGRTAWTLADARALAGILGVSIDALVACAPIVDVRPAVPA